MRNPPASVKRILLVEDEPAITLLCQRVLIGEGFTVETAVNGEEAWEMLGEKDYSLILIDVKMPVMNGKEFFHYLGEKYPRLVARTVLTSGDVISGETRRFLKQSGRPFLPKPFTPDELKSIVRDTLGQMAK